MAAEVEGGGHWLSHGYLGCLGTGMPFAIAAKAAHPDRPVPVHRGRRVGGAQLRRVRHHGAAPAPIVTVVNNDGLWGMSAHGQDLVYGPGRRVVTELGPVRYDLAAEGFGCHPEYVEQPGELRRRARARVQERPTRRAST